LNFEFIGNGKLGYDNAGLGTGSGSTSNSCAREPCGRSVRKPYFIGRVTRAKLVSVEYK
jgi:hypothetical protein